MNVRIATCIGGTYLKTNIKKLEKGVHVVVGTLGRLMQLALKQFLNLETIKTLIVDEADKMFGDASFRGDMKKVCIIMLGISYSF